MVNVRTTGLAKWLAIGAPAAALLMPVASSAAPNNSALIDAAKRGDRIAASRWLDEGADVNARAVDETTPLHWAVRADSVDTATLLLESGADAAAADRYGVTPLFLAAENGDAALIAKLLDAGVPVDSVAPTGETALMTATRTGKPDSIALLLDRGATVDAREPEYQQTALMLAVRENHPEVVKLLIERGADVNAQTRVGPTPKFAPPCKGTGCGSEGVGINRGGLPDRGRRNAALGGMTPLLYAARDGRLEAARLLLDASANIELAEANGMRPLLMALLNDQVEVARLLIEHGADPNADDFWGRSPLFAAVDFRNLDMNNRDEDSPTTNYVDREPLLAMMALLIEHGANVNAQTREVPPSRRWLYSLGDVSWVDFTGQTPFLRAALAGDVPAMRLLLEHGADPNLPTGAGTTPLMAAAGVNWVVAQTYTVSKEALLDAIDLCFEHGADVNATNSMGLTALLGAANRGSNEIIDKLAEHGADLYAVDKEGRGAVRWAEGVFLAAVGAERKPATIALLNELMGEQQSAAR
jgi:ankyrin repeat protein